MLKNTFTVKKHKNCFQSKIDTFIGITIFSQGTRMVTYFAGLKKTKSGFSRFIGTTRNSKRMKLLKLAKKMCLKMNVTINLILD